MLVSLGKRQVAEDVVDLLLECHGRIRKFLAMARELAAATAAQPAEIADVAQQVRRYFSESLPLHIDDEHEDILPRLSGAGADVDRALAAMEAEHVSHAPIVTRLVELCGLLVGDPRQLAAVAPELITVVDRLSTEFSVHLEREESVIFPALRQLPAAVRDQVLVAMRERRARAMR